MRANARYVWHRWPEFFRERLRLLKELQRDAGQPRKTHLASPAAPLTATPGTGAPAPD